MIIKLPIAKVVTFIYEQTIHTTVYIVFDENVRDGIA